VFAAEAEGAGLSPGRGVPGAWPVGNGSTARAAEPGPEVDVPDPESTAAEPIPIRPLSYRELLDLPFALIQARIRLLAGLAGAGFVVAEVLVVALTAAGSALSHGSDAGTAWAAVVSSLVFAWMLRCYLRGTTVAIGLAQVRGRPFGWRDALGLLSTRFGPLLWSAVLYTLVAAGVLAAGALLVLTLIPAVIWLAWLRARRLLTVPVLLAEGVPYSAVGARATLLAAGSEWQLVGLWLYLRFLVGVLAVPLLGIPLFVSDYSGTHRWAFITLATAWFLLVAAFAEVVESATRVLVYVDRRCRREAWDIRIPAPVQSRRLPAESREGLR
jgi:hypothetical protein